MDSKSVLFCICFHGPDDQRRSFSGSLVFFFFPTLQTKFPCVNKTCKRCYSHTDDGEDFGSSCFMIFFFVKVNSRPNPGARSCNFSLFSHPRIRILSSLVV